MTQFEKLDLLLRECGYRQRIYQRGHQPDKTPYNGDNSSVFTLYAARAKCSGAV